MVGALAYLDTVSGSRWVAVGDAASSWDPLSSAGILKALRTSKFGAFAILDAIRERKADCKIPADHRREYVRYQQDRRDVYRMEQRWNNRHSGSAGTRRQIEDNIAPLQSGEMMTTTFHAQRIGIFVYDNFEPIDARGFAEAFRSPASWHGLWGPPPYPFEIVLSAGTATTSKVSMDHRWRRIGISRRPAGAA
jgi:hypothetical protein